MTTTAQAIRAARRLAATAAATGAGLLACPYPGSGTSVQKACRRAWVNEYRHRRPTVAADLTGDVDELAAGEDGPDTTAVTSSPNLFVVKAD